MSEYKGRSAAEPHQVWRGRVTLVARVQDSTLGEEQRYFPPQKKDCVEPGYPLFSALGRPKQGWLDQGCSDFLLG